MPKLGSVQNLRAANRAVLLRELYVNGPRSRSELGVATRLSAGSVSGITGELIAEGIIGEAGSVSSGGGRPRTLLRVDPDFARVIGVDVGETRVVVDLFDLALQVTARADLPLRHGATSVDEVVDHVVAGVWHVMRGPELARRRLLGVGVGVPGGVTASQLVNSRTIGWCDVPLAELLRAELGTEVQVDNGVKTMSQAEMWFGAGRGARQAIVTLVGSGVGASIVADGSSYRGATGIAGEWGHTTVRVGGRRCRCGANGCLEAYVGAGAILDRYRACEDGAALPDGEEAGLTALVERARTSSTAATILQETAEHLAAGVSSLANLLDPERIIIGGWVGLLLGRWLLPAARAAVTARPLRQPGASSPEVELACLGPDAVARGAATLPVARFLEAGGLLPAPSSSLEPTRAR